MFQCVWYHLVDILQVLFRNLLGSSHLWFGSYFVGMTLSVRKISSRKAFSLFVKFLAKSGKIKENILEKSGENFIKFLYKPCEPISSSHACSSNIVSASNICPSKTVSASNVYSGKPICTNYVRPSRSICGSKVCQSKPTSASTIHHKPIHPNHICFINSSLSTQQISFIFLLSLLSISVYSKYSFFKMNIFINLFLVTLILLTKLTCFRKFFILYISWSSTFLRSNLNIYIVFQSSRTILLLNTIHQRFLFSLKVYVFLPY